MISCGKNNSYGHPTDEVMMRLDLAGVKYFRTDENGSIMFTIKSNEGFGVNFIK